MQNSLAFLSVGGGNLRIYAAYEASLVYFKLKIILRKSRLYLFDFSDKNGFTKNMRYVTEKRGHTQRNFASIQRYNYVSLFYSIFYYHYQVSLYHCLFFITLIFLISFIKMLHSGTSFSLFLYT